MIIKTTGLIVFILGFIFTLYSGLDFITKEKGSDVGSFLLIKGKKQTTSWSPLIGIGAMIIGGVIIISGNKKQYKPRKNLTNL